METGKQPTPEVDIAVSVRSIIVTEVKSKVGFMSSFSLALPDYSHYTEIVRGH